jgi:NADH-quinone oxidoreductase subunit M
MNFLTFAVLLRHLSMSKFYIFLLLSPLVFILCLVGLQTINTYYPLLLTGAYSFINLLKKLLKVFIGLYSFVYSFLVFIFIYVQNFEVYYAAYPSEFFKLVMGNTSIFFESYGTQYFNFAGYSLKFLFHIDILGLLFMCLSGLLIFLCILFLWPTFELEKNIVLYLSQLILLLTQLQLTFTAGDLLTFFVAFESLLIPMIIMITIWGSPNRRQANNYLVFYTMVSAIPMLLAILYLKQTYGDLEMRHLSLILTMSWTEQVTLWLAFFFAFAVKTPMVPVHIWLPKAHVDAPTVASVILAGLLLKIGLIGFIRILLPVFPEATHFFAPYVSSLATIGVLYASLITLRQIDMKRIIAYSSVAHMNMAIVSLCSLNVVGVYSSIYLMLSHGLIASGLFFLVGFLYSRFHVRTVSYFGGLATIMPVMTILFFVFSLANMAFPFTSGFIGELLLLLSITSTNYFLGFLNTATMLFTSLYSLLLFGRVFLGELKPQLQKLVEDLLYLAVDMKKTNEVSSSFLLKRFSVYDLYYYEFIIMIILLTLILIGGIYPQIIFSGLVKSPTLTWVCASL